MLHYVHCSGDVQCCNQPDTVLMVTCLVSQVPDHSIL